MHAIEAASPAELRRLQTSLLIDQMQYLGRRSDFYRAKFAETGIKLSSIRSLDDLSGLPLTTKDEIRVSLEAHRPLGSHLAAPLESVQFQCSSGTSGKPSHVALTSADLADWTEVVRRSLVGMGIRPDDRALHAFGLSRGWVGALPVIEGLQALGAGVIPIGAEPGSTWLLNVLRDLQPSVLLATPSLAIYLGEQAESVVGSPARELTVRRIWTGGEPGGGIPATRARAEELWDAQMREVMGGTDISAVIWAECEQGTGMHFSAPESVYVEMLSLDDQSPVAIEEGAVGELVYTHLRREASPLLRLRHADIVEVVGMDCACGRTGPKIRCLGRTDDMFIVKGVNVYPTAIQDIVMGFRPRTTGAMRIVRTDDRYSFPGPLRVRVELSRAVAAADKLDLVARLAQEILDLCRCRAVIDLVPPGTFPPPGREKVTLVEEPGQGYNGCAEPADR
jgi:phenylacetate-CoA ligase